MSSTPNSSLPKTSVPLKPIEALAELLPQKHWDSLRDIHRAGQEQRWENQIQFLDGLRRTISSERGDPTVGAQMRDRIAQSLHLIDAERGSAKDRMAGPAQPSLAVRATDAATMPAPMAKAVDEFSTRAGSLDPKMAHEAALYLARLQLCAKQGAFDLMQRYSEKFVAAARESHANNPQPLLGPVAVKAREIGEMARQLKEGQMLSGPAADEPKREAKAVASPRVVVQPSATPGNFVLEALRRHPPEMDRLAPSKPKLS